ncbi:MAG: NUMOD4 motif-containing HNH endonuclease [Sphaerochaetaceae bacterium]|nr:NUMOD4 motif-containing HNH endonuclease [Sphaerochaetaceae bacterium]
MNTKETWKSITGYEGYYEVSNFGRVRSLHISSKGKEPIILSTKSLCKGYPLVYLFKNKVRKTIFIHQLVAQEFLGYVIGGDKVVDHIDENPLNNKVTNLQLVSIRYNTSKGKRKMGNYPTGVCFHKRQNKLNSQLQINGKVVFLGYFNIDEIEKASDFYKIAVENVEKYENNKQFRELINSLYSKSKNSA